MKHKFAVLVTSLWVGGCGGNSVQELQVGDDPPGACGGYMSPSANIFVIDAMHDSAIENASVTVNLIGESSSDSRKAIYTDGDDNFANSDAGAYYASAELNELNYLINVVVTVDGYDEYFSEDAEFVVNTACGAENNFRYTARLCPEGAACE